MDNEGYNPELDPGRDSSPLPNQVEEKTNYANRDSQETRVDMGLPLPKKQHKPIATEPYAGMGKEDLLRFSDTPFWNRLRMGCLIAFWLGWLALLAAVIVLTIVMPRCSSPPATEDWQKTTYYQVYVRSFYDSDGDGVGDLKGIEAKLEYIQSLNVDTVLLSSFYVSQADGDFGYDIIEHKDVDPRVGTMADFESLLAKAHSMNMKIVVEFVPNHTGKEHPWFNASAGDGSQSNPYWNYYVWESCPPGPPPTNWRSVYGGSAWRDNTDPNRPNECYLAQFLDTQPDLNLRSEAVKEELRGILEFWLEKGVDGFRVNSPSFLFEDVDLRDEPETCSIDDDYNCLEHIYTRNQPNVYDMILEWKGVLLDYTESTGQYRLLLTDAVESVNDTIRYFGEYGGNGANLAFNYQLSAATMTSTTPCGGMCVQDLVEEWLSVLHEDSTSNWVTSNQDMPRLIGELGELYSGAIQILTFTLPGPKIAYFGEEIGMTNAINLNQDDPAGNIDPAFSRDNFRTPMQWNNRTNAGFTNSTSTPYLPVNSDYSTKNVQVQEANPGSQLELFRSLAHLFNEQMALHLGDYIPAVVNENIFSFVREFNGQNSYLVAVNVGQDESTDSYSSALEEIPGSGTVVATSGTLADMDVDDKVSLRDLTLGRGEGVVIMWEYKR